ncbi:ABC transporter ATP-binding protein [Paenibacillus marinisediminis]
MSVLDVNIEEAGYDQGDIKIRNIQFEVEPGQLVGIIGPNGAGKSTTIKTVMGVMRHVKGTIRVGGDGGYAYVPEQPVLYETMTLWEHLELAAAAFKLPKDVFEQRAHELLERFQLTEVVHHYPTSFSKGMQQKLMLIIAFMLKPPLYIVDEPFIGLDPRATRRLLDMLQEAREQGAGVLMSTHVLDTAERICDTFILIHQGGIVAQGTFEDIRAQCGLPQGSLMDCFEVLT